jgi:hypothetical protein
MVGITEIVIPTLFLILMEMSLVFLHWIRFWF